MHLPPKAVPVSIPLSTASRPTSARAAAPRGVRSQPNPPSAPRSSSSAAEDSPPSAARYPAGSRVASAGSGAVGRHPERPQRLVLAQQHRAGQPVRDGVERHVGGEVVPAVGHRRRHPAVPEPGERAAGAAGRRPRGRSRPRAPGPPRPRPARPGRARAPRARSPPPPGRPATDAGHHRCAHAASAGAAAGPSRSSPVGSTSTSRRCPSSSTSSTGHGCTSSSSHPTSRAGPDAGHRLVGPPHPVGQPVRTRREVDADQLQVRVRRARRRRAARRRPRPTSTTAVHPADRASRATAAPRTVAGRHRRGAEVPGGRAGPQVEPAGSVEGAPPGRRPGLVHAGGGVRPGAARRPRR